jgi:hypothetical protein
MRDYFDHRGTIGIRREALQTIFDAERETPALIDAVAMDTPQIREVMANLRESLPLMPHSRVGHFGQFHRLPNHYRSVSFMLAPVDRAGAESIPGVIVFKGTEPLLPDFPTYFEWMLETPFRSSVLTLGLHFPLDLKLPPAAMWINECIAEQAVTSELQERFLGRHGRLARLPVPLFVFKMTSQQTERYERVISSRISKDAMKKIKNKLTDGIGVEVYFYPELPVRVNDLFVGNMRDHFKPALSPEQVEHTIHEWVQLFSELLCLDYMPYAPWHHGMGGCVDPGNVCIDGGFNDLLTLVPFDSIPDDVLFRNSLAASIKMLAESIVGLLSVHTGLQSPNKDPEGISVAVELVTEEMRGHVRAAEKIGHKLDERLARYCNAPQVAEICSMISEPHRRRAKGTQYLAPEDTSGAQADVNRPGLSEAVD